jgi:hypothetical protein
MRSRIAAPDFQVAGLVDRGSGGVFVALVRWQIYSV